MKMSSSPLAASCLAIALASPCLAGESKTSEFWGCEVPNYVTEASLDLKVSYDSNVYGTETNLVGAPEVANQGAAVFTISPTYLLNGIKLWDIKPDGALRSMSIGYTGTYTLFSGYSDESSFRHNLPFSLKAASGDWTFNLSNTVTYVDGSKDSALYNTYSAYGTAFARERREQIQNRFKTQLQVDLGKSFLRASFAALSYDLKTNQHSASLEPEYKGFQNWIDRSDLNGGLDFGLKANDKLSLLAGWRLGTQTQKVHDFGGKHCDSTYNRLLIGFEGAICSHLKGSLMVGPDFRRYSDADILGLTGDSHTWFYGESALSATLSDSDSLTASALVWHWVSSTGNVSYQDALYKLTWKHSFDKRLSMTAGVVMGDSNYDAPVARRDQLFFFPIGLSYAFAKEAVLGLEYRRTETKDLEAGTSGRTYDQDLVSISFKLSL